MNELETATFESKYKNLFKNEDYLLKQRATIAKHQTLNLVKSLKKRGHIVSNFNLDKFVCDGPSTDISKDYQFLLLDSLYENFQNDFNIYPRVSLEVKFKNFGGIRQIMNKPNLYNLKLYRIDDTSYFPNLSQNYSDLNELKNNGDWKEIVLLGLDKDKSKSLVHLVIRNN